MYRANNPAPPPPPTQVEAAASAPSAPPASEMPAAEASAPALEEAAEVPMKIEVLRGDEVVRRRRLRLLSPTLQDVQLSATTGVMGEFRLEYTDDEGDSILLDTPDEWDECLALWQRAGGEARGPLLVRVVQPPAGGQLAPAACPGCAQQAGYGLHQTHCCRRCAASPGAHGAKCPHADPSTARHSLRSTRSERGGCRGRRSRQGSDGNDPRLDASADAPVQAELHGDDPICAPAPLPPAASTEGDGPLCPGCGKRGGFGLHSTHCCCNCAKGRGHGPRCPHHDREAQRALRAMRKNQQEWGDDATASQLSDRSEFSCKGECGKGWKAGKALKGSKGFKGWKGAKGCADFPHEHDEHDVADAPPADELHGDDPICAPAPLPPQ